MEMATRQITVRTLESAPRSKSEMELWDTQLSGFGLRRTKANQGGFFIRYTDPHGKSKRMSIGKYRIGPDKELSEGVLADARGRARELIAIAAIGKDPRAYLEQKTSPERDIDLTVEGLFRRYFEERVLVKCRESTAREIKRGFEKDILPIFGKEILPTLDHMIVLAHLEEKAKTAPVGANRLFAYMSGFWTWAARKPSLKLAGIVRNPMLGEPKPYDGEAGHARDRILSHGELHRLLNVLPDFEPRGFAGLIEFLMRTGCRRGEGAMLTWDRVDFEAETIRFDAEHVKNGAPMVLPITPALKALLEAQAGRSGAVFKNTVGQPFRNNWARLTGRLWETVGVDETGTDGKPLPKPTPHDLRRTLRTALTEECGVDAYIAERVLNHKVLGVEGRYARGKYIDQKREALLAWELRLAVFAAGDSVVVQKKPNPA
jgi:integrase